MSLHGDGKPTSLPFGLCVSLSVWLLLKPAFGISQTCKGDVLLFAGGRRFSLLLVTLSSEPEPFSSPLVMSVCRTMLFLLFFLLSLKLCISVIKVMGMGRFLGREKIEFVIFVSPHIS